MAEYAAGYSHDSRAGAIPGSSDEKGDVMLKTLGDIDPAEVQKWDCAMVVEKFLLPLNLGQYAEEFHSNAITGRVISSLSKDDLKEIGVKSVGHRVLLAEGMHVLKKKHIDLQRNLSLWRGDQPYQGHCGYYDSCCSWLWMKCMRSCYTKKIVNITSKSIKTRTVPGCCFRGAKKINTDNVDYRFLKDIELDSEPSCCCFCRVESVTITSDDESHPIMTIRHPDAAKLERIIRNSWADARLVSAGE